MTGKTCNMNPDELPDVEAVRAWATKLVSARGDAFCNWLYVDGLYVEKTRVLGENVQLMRESVGTPFDGGVHIARRIELAEYPDADFAPPFWDHPDREQFDVPTQQGGQSAFTSYRFSNRQTNTIHLPHPLAWPTLVRKVVWRDWVPELEKGRIEVVEYTLLELEPQFQREALAADAVRPTMAEWLSGSRKAQ